MNSLQSSVVIIILAVISAMPLVSQSTYIPIQDQGFTSTAHQKNVGKIVWANQRITFNKQDEIAFSEVFEAGSPLYGRGYLPKCLYNLSIDEGDNNCLNPDSDFELRIQIDGIDKGILHKYYIQSQEFTTFQINLSLSSGDSEDAMNQGLTAKWADIVNQLDKGKHEIAIDFYGGKNGCEKKKYAESKFTLNKASDSKIKGSGAEVPKALM